MTDEGTIGECQKLNDAICDLLPGRPRYVVALVLQSLCWQLELVDRVTWERARKALQARYPEDET